LKYCTAIRTGWIDRVISTGCGAIISLHIASACAGYKSAKSAKSTYICNLSSCHTSSGRQRKRRKYTRRTVLEIYLDGPIAANPRQVLHVYARPESVRDNPKTRGSDVHIPEVREKFGCRKFGKARGHRRLTINLSQQVSPEPTGNRVCRESI